MKHVLIIGFPAPTHEIGDRNLRAMFRNLVLRQLKLPEPVTFNHLRNRISSERYAQIDFVSQRESITPPLQRLANNFV
jgi:hypothetical protein